MLLLALASLAVACGGSDKGAEEPTAIVTEEGSEESTEATEETTEAEGQTLTQALETFCAIQAESATIEDPAERMTAIATKAQEQITNEDFMSTMAKLGEVAPEERMPMLEALFEKGGVESCLPEMPAE